MGRPPPSRGFRWRTLERSTAPDPHLPPSSTGRDTPWASPTRSDRQGTEDRTCRAGPPGGPGGNCKRWAYRRPTRPRRSSSKYTHQRRPPSKQCRGRRRSRHPGESRPDRRGSSSRIRYRPRRSRYGRHMARWNRAGSTIADRETSASHRGTARRATSRSRHTRSPRGGPTHSTRSDARHPPGTARSVRLARSEAPRWRHRRDPRSSRCSSHRSSSHPSGRWQNCRSRRRPRGQRPPVSRRRPRIQHRSGPGSSFRSRARKQPRKRLRRRRSPRRDATASVPLRFPQNVPPQRSRFHLHLTVGDHRADQDGHAPLRIHVRQRI
jgi:hypothetical protein